jgi:hypothetical protein
MYSGCDIHGPIRVIYRKITIDVLLNPRFYLREDNRYKYKPTQWSTEKEVRFVRRDGFGIVNTPVSCVKEIILGERLDLQFRRDLIDEIQYGILEAGIDFGSVTVYQAIGDAEGKVYIEPDAELNSLIYKQQKTFYDRMQQQTKVPYKDMPYDDNVPSDDDIPF